MCCVVSRSIVELHGGTISVQSEGMGRGCVFAVELPLYLESKPRHSVSLSRDSKSHHSTHLVYARRKSSLVSTEICTGSNLECNVSRKSSNTVSPSPSINVSVPINKYLLTENAASVQKINHRGQNISDVASTHNVSNMEMRSIPDGKWEIPPPSLLSRGEEKGEPFSEAELSVLVVDDAPLNRKMLIRLLFGKFKSIREAVDGRDAVNKVKDILARCEPLDVILMDFVMPQLNGPDAVREIRNMGYTGVVIGVTGNAQQEDIDVFLYHGSDRVISKPVDVVALLKIIDGT